MKKKVLVALIAALNIGYIEANTIEATSKLKLGVQMVPHVKSYAVGKFYGFGTGLTVGPFVEYKLFSSFGIRCAPSYCFSMAIGAECYQKPNRQDMINSWLQFGVEKLFNIIRDDIQIIGEVISMHEIIQALKNRKIEFVKNATPGIAKLHLITCPIACRFYPEAKKKIAISIVSEFYIAVAGFFKDITKYEEISFENPKGYKKFDLKKTPESCGRYGLNFTLGLDYETNCGLILGTQIGKEFNILLAYNFYPLICQATAASKKNRS